MGRGFLGWFVGLGAGLEAIIGREFGHVGVMWVNLMRQQVNWGSFVLTNWGRQILRLRAMERGTS